MNVIGIHHSLWVCFLFYLGLSGFSTDGTGILIIVGCFWLTAGLSVELEDKREDRACRKQIAEDL